MLIKSKAANSASKSPVKLPCNCINPPELAKIRIDKEAKFILSVLLWIIHPQNKIQKKPARAEGKRMANSFMPNTEALITCNQIMSGGLVL